MSRIWRAFFSEHVLGELAARVERLTFRVRCDVGQRQSHDTLFESLYMGGAPRVACRFWRLKATERTLLRSGDPHACGYETLMAMDDTRTKVFETAREGSRIEVSADASVCGDWDPAHRTCRFWWLDADGGKRQDATYYDADNGRGRWATVSSASVGGVHILKAT